MDKALLEEKIKEFIKRCCEELNYTELTLHTAIAHKLKHETHSGAEAEILPYVHHYLATGEIV